MKAGSLRSSPRRFASFNEARHLHPSWTVPFSHFYFLRSEEHTSELQSQSNLVCRLLLEKKKTRMSTIVVINELEHISEHISFCIHMFNSYMISLSRELARLPVCLVVDVVMHRDVDSGDA